MTSVKELINSSINNQKVSVEGTIVIIDHKLCIIDSSYIQHYLNSPKIEIKNSNLKSILLKSVALYSGVTALFHDILASGFISENNRTNQIDINVVNLSIKDGDHWENIDLNNFVIEEHKQKDEIDWFDL